jgi:hypothetical protein
MGSRPDFLSENAATFKERVILKSITWVTEVVTKFKTFLLDIFGNFKENDFWGVGGGWAHCSYTVVTWI